jgi:hypothetical protein
MLKNHFHSLVNQNLLIRKYGIGDENMDVPSVSGVLWREKGQDQQQIVLCTYKSNINGGGF